MVRRMAFSRSRRGPFCSHDHEGGVPHGSGGQVDIPLRRFVQSGVACARDDSNDPLPVVRILRRAIDADSLSDGAGARPQSRGDKIIHDRGVIRVGHLLFAEPAAFEETDAHGLEILAAHVVYFSLDLRSFCGADVSAVILAAKRQRVHGSGAFDSGKRAHRIQNSLVEQRSLCGVGVPLGRGQHHRRQNAIRLETRIGADQLHKAGQQFAADHHQDDRNGNLGCYE